MCACMEATAELFLGDGFEPGGEEAGQQQQQQQQQEQPGGNSTVRIEDID